MQLKIAIIDDVAADAQALESLVRAFFAAHAPAYDLLLSCYGSAEEFLTAGESAEPFLVFLDIRMAGMTGIEAARELRRRSISTLLVFITSSPEYVWDALPVHPFDYLLKPAAQADADRILTEALRTLGAREPMIDIRIAYGTVSVPAGHIRAIVSCDHALNITLTSGESIRSIQTFAQLSDRLKGDPRFLLCNRGVLINMDETLQFTGDCFILRDGIRLPVRQRDKAGLTQRFAAHQLARLRRT